MPEPRTLIGAWKEMRDVWKTAKDRIQTIQFDTPLPPHRQ